jgi:hypothetical protein
MAVSSLVAATSGLAVGRFPAAIGAPFQIPAGLTLQNTVTSTTTFTAGQLPAQVFAVIVGGGGGGSGGYGGQCGGGGGGACIGWVDVPSSGITATIGAGGTAGVGSNGNGGRGGTTVFGAYAAFGGGGGIPSDVFNNPNSSPLGDGAGYGGSLTSTPNATNRYFPGPKGSPFIGGMQLPMGATNTSYLNILGSLAIYNYNGGGAGASAVFSNQLGLIGLPGLTGGGGGPANAGGGSSRDGGVSITFAGGAHVSGNAGGGGAGLLAVGASGTTSSGGAGGSGGGGGGCGPNANTNNGGAGGAGCVLIYY